MDETIHISWRYIWISRFHISVEAKQFGGNCFSFRPSDWQECVCGVISGGGIITLHVVLWKHLKPPQAWPTGSTQTWTRMRSRGSSLKRLMFMCLSPNFRLCVYAKVWLCCFTAHVILQVFLQVCVYLDGSAVLRNLSVLSHFFFFCPSRISIPHMPTCLSLLTSWGAGGILWLHHR